MGLCLYISMKNADLPTFMKLTSGSCFHLCFLLSLKNGKTWQKFILASAVQMLIPQFFYKFDYLTTFNNPDNFSVRNKFVYQIFELELEIKPWTNQYMLYILTSAWVLHTPNAGRNIHFQLFLGYFDQHLDCAAPKCWSKSTINTA